MITKKELRDVRSGERYRVAVLRELGPWRRATSDALQCGVGYYCVSHEDGVTNMHGKTTVEVEDESVAPGHGAGDVPRK